MAKNLAYDECRIMKFHYRNPSNYKESKWYGVYIFDRDRYELRIYGIVLSNVLCKLFTQVVFALKAVAEYSTVEIFHDLSQQIGVAIKYEER